MSEPNPPQNRPGEPPREQRLTPRPLDRPAVDPAQAATFGRPRGVDGAFDKLYAPDSRNGNEPDKLPLAPPPPESLAEAFRRPPGAEDVVLQRPHDDNGSAPANGSEPPLWTSSADPWRDPGAGAVLAGPAVGAEREAEAEAPRPRGAMLSLPEVLFGRRVKPTALGLLGVIALLIGALGGLVGWWLTSTAESLTGDAKISEAEAGKERAPGSIADIAKRIAPSVISLEVGAPGQPGGQGSGVMIDTQGYAITNDHVISDAVRDSKVKVTAVFFDGTRAEAKVVGTDPKTDVAVIKVAVSNPVAIQVGKSADLQVGDSVIALGSPLGLENTVTQGIVSALNRPVTAGGTNGEPPVVYDAIQTDASINRGNSGGALVDSTGALIGINESIRTDAGPGGQGGSIGLGFAIPIDDAIKIARTLIKDGQVKHADIGINASSVEASTSKGAQVQNVAPGGPAAKAGIAEQDVIIKVGDRMVRNAAELTVAVRRHSPGDTVPVQLVRQGTQITVDVPLGSD